MPGAHSRASRIRLNGVSAGLEPVAGLRYLDGAMSAHHFEECLNATRTQQEMPRSICPRTEPPVEETSEVPERLKQLFQNLTPETSLLHACSRYMAELKLTDFNLWSLLIVAVPGETSRESRAITCARIGKTTRNGKPGSMPKLHLAT